MTIQQNRFILVYPLLLALLIGGCASLTANIPAGRELPPILSQDELIRPYVTIGRIQITREVYGIIDPIIIPEIREWGYGAIRTEASEMGADAVILPEITGRGITYLVIPSTEYRAAGVAIKFK